jgi:hypothetical protein
VKKYLNITTQANHYCWPIKKSIIFMGLLGGHFIMNAFIGPKWVSILHPKCNKQAILLLQREMLL